MVKISSSDDASHQYLELEGVDVFQAGTYTVSDEDSTIVRTSVFISRNKLSEFSENTYMWEGIGSEGAIGQRFFKIE